MFNGDLLFNELKELLKKYPISGCNGKCGECKLAQNVFTMSDYSYDVCDLLEYIKSNT